MSDRHYYRPYAKAMEERSRPDTSIMEEQRQRERDAYFVRKLALAIWRGDNLPAGQPKPLRLMG